MDKTRFAALTKEEKIKLTLDDFTVSEILEIISETVLSDEDRKIAELRYTKAMTLERIAERLSLDWKTVQKRINGINGIKEKLKSTVYKIV